MLRQASLLVGVFVIDILSICSSFSFQIKYVSNFQSNFDLFGGSEKQQLMLEGKLLDIWYSGQPGLGRCRKESALPPLLVRGRVAPAACAGCFLRRPLLPPAPRSAPRPPPRGVQTRPPLLGHTKARAGRVASSSRAAPRRGASLAGRPAPLTDSCPVGGRGTKRSEQGLPRRAD